MSDPAPEPKRWKQLLFPWAEEEQREMAKELERVHGELAKRTRWRDVFSVAGLIAGILGMMALVCKASEYMDRKGKMLEAEWKLKYDEKGQPRPEYWAHRLDTEQELEAERLWQYRLQRDRSHDIKAKRGR